MTIAATHPGSEYRIVTKDPSGHACLFVNRVDLVRYCKSLLCTAPIVAEVGVFKAQFSDTLLDVLQPAQMFLIDTFQIADYIAGEFTADQHFEYVNQKYADMSNVFLLQNLSWEGLDLLPDNCLDYVYIDADHTYDGVKKDIEVAYKKVRSGGILQFNDYTTYSSCEKMEYGVVTAVNEFLEAYSNVSIVGLSLDRSGFHDIALKILKK